MYHVAALPLSLQFKLGTFSLLQMSKDSSLKDTFKQTKVI